MIAVCWCQQRSKNFLAKVLPYWVKHPSVTNDYFSQLAAETNPTDLIEWVYIKDLADTIWEMLRLRRWKAALVNARYIQLSRFKSFAELEDRTYELMEKRAIPLPNVDPLELDLVCFAAAEIHTLDGLEKMLVSAERRQTRILQEIGQYREEWRHTLRRVSEKLTLEEAEKIPIAATPE